MPLIKKSIFLFTFFSIFTLISCQLEVPIKEMVKAKTTISRAYEVKADKYSKENLDKALEHLYKCHTWLEKEKIKQAKQNATLAYQFADMAINQTLPFLGQDSLEEAKKIYEEAKVLYAEDLTPIEFSLLDNTIKNAQDLQSQNQYWDSYTTSQEAVKIGYDTINKVLAVTQALPNELEQLSQKIDQLQKEKYYSIAEEKIKVAAIKITEADTLIKSNNLATITVLIKEIKTLITEAENRIKKYNYIEKINKVIEDTNKLIKDKGEDYASQEIENIEVHLNQAETLLDNNEFEGVDLQIMAAEENLKAAQEKRYKALVSEKLTTAKNLLDNINAKITEDEYNKDLKEAINFLSSGESYFQEGLYLESNESLSKALPLLESVWQAIKKDSYNPSITFVKSTKGQSKYPFNYTVKYRKVNTDCLWRIALNLYNNAALWPIIYRANKNKIKSVDLIYPGQVFKIPRPKRKRKRK